MRPFSRQQALAVGLTDQELRGPDYVKVLGAVFVSSRVGLTPHARVQAGLMVHPPDAIATHTSVARLMGAPVPSDPLVHITVVNPGDRRQRHGLRCHVAAIAEEDVRILQGLRVSAPARMFVELAGQLNLIDLVIVGDWLVRHEHVSVEELRSYCARSRLRYARRAKDAATYVRAGVDSPMETRLRLLIVLAGLPEPEVDVKLVDEYGQVYLRADLGYRSVKLAVEYDGRHHDEPQQRSRDGDRRDEFEEGSWRLLVVRADGIYGNPAKTIARVWRALQARGFEPLTPPTDGWRAHFAR